MKKMFFFLAGVLFFFGCNENKTPADVTTHADSVKTETIAANVTYPYTIDHPDNWEIGSNANTITALSAIKGFEDNNIDESLKYFADSVRLEFDGLDTKVSKDSLKALFTEWRADSKSMKIKMNDWESVKSKDGKEEWVTLWYREYWEDDKGKDSIDFINELQLKDGKISSLVQYSRKLH